MLVHERLNQFIKSQGMTQVGLARRLGPDSSWEDWVGDRLRGRTLIKADEVPLIAKALGVSACWLLLGDDEPVQSKHSVKEASTIVAEMQARYQGMLTAMGIEPEDSDIVIAIAEFLRQRRLQSVEG